MTDTNLGNYGLGHGCSHCEDSSLERNCCMAHYGQSFPHLSVGPSVTLRPYSPEEKQQFSTSMAQSRQVSIVPTIISEQRSEQRSVPGV
jgi:hypothetical protein